VTIAKLVVKIVMKNTLFSGMTIRITIVSLSRRFGSRRAKPKPKTENRKPTTPPLSKGQKKSSLLETLI